MKFALLIYGPRAVSEGVRELDPAITAVLERPGVDGWIRLHGVDLATTIQRRQNGRLVTDGPFIESKEYLNGLVVLDVVDLDAALTVAEELQEARAEVVIEVRPVLEAA